MAVDDHDRIRHRCQLDFARRAVDEDTLMTCVACDGTQLVRVDTDPTGQSYRMFSCPWCGGRGTTTCQMIALYRKYEREGPSAL